jgi:hypothetical protein
MAKRFKLVVKRLGGMPGEDIVQVTHGESVAHLQPMSIKEGELCEPVAGEECSWCLGLKHRIGTAYKATNKREIKLRMRFPNEPDDKAVVFTLCHGEWAAIDRKVIMAIEGGELCNLGDCKWCDAVQNALADYVCRRVEAKEVPVLTQEELVEKLDAANDEILKNTVREETREDERKANIDPGTNEVDESAETKVMEHAPMPGTVDDQTCLAESNLEMRSILSDVLGHIGTMYDDTEEIGGKDVPVTKCGACHAFTKNTDDSALEDYTWHLSDCMLARTKRVLKQAEDSAQDVSFSAAKCAQEVLNAALDADTPTVQALFMHRMECSEDLAKMDGVMVTRDATTKKPHVGILGLLNAILSRFGPYRLGGVALKADPNSAPLSFAVVNLDAIESKED